MAKLPRVTAKVFASNAAPADIGQYGSALTGTKLTTGDISEIQALPAYEVGWRGAVISNRNYPTLQEMNGLQKTFSQQIAYTLQTGIPEWDANTEYYANTSFCQINGTWYQSLTDNNIGNNPLTDTTNWQKFSYVKVSGDTMTGPLSINYGGSTSLRIIDPRYQQGVTPAEALHSSIIFRRADNSNLGAVEIVENTDGSQILYLQRAKQDASGNNTYSRLGVGFDSNGNNWTSAPASVNQNAILTLGGYHFAGTGYIRLAMGLMIQWGRISVSNNGTATVTLPVSFTNGDSYRVLSIANSGTSTTLSSGLPTLGNKIASSFRLGNTTGVNNLGCEWIAIGY